MQYDANKYSKTVRKEQACYDKRLVTSKLAVYERTFTVEMLNVKQCVSRERLIACKLSWTGNSRYTPFFLYKYQLHISANIRISRLRESCMLFLKTEDDEMNL